MGADLAFCRARLGELRASALRLDSDGNVERYDPDTWAQADELAAVLGEDVGDIIGLMRRDGRWSAWLYDSQWLLRWRQPETWEACCRLYAADCAERALDLYDGDGDPRSREAVRVARLHARGRASDAELEAAQDAAWAAVGDAAWAPVGDAAWGAAAWAAADAAGAAARNTAWNAARAAARADARADAGAAARTEERRIQWPRLLQYAHHGPAAAEMEWEVSNG